MALIRKSDGAIYDMEKGDWVTQDEFRGMIEHHKVTDKTPKPKKSPKVELSPAETFKIFREMFGDQLYEDETSGRAWFGDDPLTYTAALKATVTISEKKGLSYSGNRAMEVMTAIASENRCRKIVNDLMEIVQPENPLPSDFGTFTANSFFCWFFGINRASKEGTEASKKFDLLLYELFEQIINGTVSQHMFVLYGGQGIGKTAFWSTVFGSSRVTNAFDYKNKDALIQLENKWINNDDEMILFKGFKSKLEAKSFYSASQFTYRRPYARDESTQYRTFINVGTTNDDSGLIRDITGDRRLVIIDLTAANRNEIQSRIAYTKRIADKGIIINMLYWYYIKKLKPEPEMMRQRSENYAKENEKNFEFDISFDDFIARCKAFVTNIDDDNVFIDNASFREMGYSRPEIELIKKTLKFKLGGKPSQMKRNGIHFNGYSFKKPIYL